MQTPQGCAITIYTRVEIYDPANGSFCLIVVRETEIRQQPEVVIARMFRFGLHRHVRNSRQ
jgi:hypothetical protein